MEKTKIGKRFQGKVAIVTASTQGIGFGIAERLGLEGASVVVSSRRQVFWDSFSFLVLFVKSNSITSCFLCLAAEKINLLSMFFYVQFDYFLFSMLGC